MSALNFDATTVEPVDDFSPIPAGEYIAAIIDSEMKATKNGQGQYLQLMLQVLEGDYKGRMVWDRLNLVNQNQTAVEIAKRTLSAICHAAGKLQVQDSAELHDIPMVVRVSVRPADGQYDASNEVKAYKAMQQSTPQQAQPAQPFQPQQQTPQQAQPTQGFQGQQPAQPQQQGIGSDDVPW